jgi:hypothetical protein
MSWHCLWEGPCGRWDSVVCACRDGENTCKTKRQRKEKDPPLFCLCICLLYNNSLMRTNPCPMRTISIHFQENPPYDLQHMDSCGGEKHIEIMLVFFI